MLKISDFLQKNKCKSANMGSCTVQLHDVDLIDIPGAQADLFKIKNKSISFRQQGIETGTRVTKIQIT